MVHLVKVELVVERRDGADGVVAEVLDELRELDGLLEVDGADLRHEGDVVLRLVLRDLEDALLLIGREHEILARAAADVEPVHLVVVDVVADDLAQPLLADAAVLVEGAKQCGIQTSEISHDDFLLKYRMIEIPTQSRR